MTSSPISEPGCVIVNKVCLPFLLPKTKENFYYRIDISEQFLLSAEDFPCTSRALSGERFMLLNPNLMSKQIKKSTTRKKLDALTELWVRVSSQVYFTQQYSLSTLTIRSDVRAFHSGTVFIESSFLEKYFTEWKIKKSYTRSPEHWNFRQLGDHLFIRLGRQVPWKVFQWSDTTTSNFTFVYSSKS